MFVSDMVGSKNVKVEKLPKTIFEEQDGSTRYSITKGIFYIPDLKAKMKAFRVMKHTNYSKPIVEYCFEKVKAELVLIDLMQVDKPIFGFDKSVLQK